MKLTLARQSPSDIDNATLEGGEVTFQLPMNVTIDRLKQLDTVNTKVRLNLSITLLSHDGKKAILTKFSKQMTRIDH